MEKKYTFNDLLQIVERLRGEGGCPWDIEQTHDSIKANVIEEGYEFIEAIEDKDFPKMADESGDLLLQVVFHAQIGKENGEYTIDDVCDAVSKKLIHRHPHVFGDADLKNSEEVLAKWNEIKKSDRGQTTVSADMEGVSKYLPTLMRAQKIQGKAGKNGYVFSEPCDVGESITRLLTILSATDDKAVAEKYIGKMLFELAAVAKAFDVDAEVALNKHIELFINEFKKHEEQ